MLHSGLDAGTVVAFLHENMVHFVADTAIADAADALAYLSDAGAPMLTCTSGDASTPVLCTAQCRPPCGLQSVSIRAMHLLMSH